MNHKKITIEDVRFDLKSTDRDISRLTAIVDNLSEFIIDPCGEDRRSYVVDLLRYESLLAEAKKLKARIKEVYEKKVMELCRE